MKYFKGTMKYYKIVHLKFQQKLLKEFNQISIPRRSFTSTNANESTVGLNGF